MASDSKNTYRAGSFSWQGSFMISWYADFIARNWNEFTTKEKTANYRLLYGFISEAGMNTC
jgi:hypothetical protein